MNENNKIEENIIGIIGGWKKIGKFNYFLFIWIENKTFKKIFIHLVDIPNQIKFGEKWLITIKRVAKIRHSFVWMFGKKIEKTIKEKNKIIQRISSIIWQIQPIIEKKLFQKKISPIWNLVLENQNESLNWINCLHLLLVIADLNGQHLTFNKCQILGERQKLNYWNLDEGGVICSTCINKLQYYQKIDKWERKILNKKPLKPSNSEQKMAAVWVNKLINFLQYRGGLGFDFFKKKIN